MIERMINGEPCAPFIQRMMNTPGALRARAEIRRVIADQDRRAYEPYMRLRNLQQAELYEGELFNANPGDRQADQKTVGKAEVGSRLLSPLPEGRPSVDGGPLHHQSDGPQVLDSSEPRDPRGPGVQEERKPDNPMDQGEADRSTHPQGTEKS